MNAAMFYHSVISDWNHGNAHFLRGVAPELQRRGHLVRIYEPGDGWGLRNLTHEYGYEPTHRFRASFPGLRSTFYHQERIDLDRVLDAADLVIVHEWNTHRPHSYVRNRRSFAGPSCTLAVRVSSAGSMTLVPLRTDGST
jgi:spore maturation protein CgeB